MVRQLNHQTSEFMNCNRFIVILILLVSFTNCSAQKYYTEGYIILLSGDTIHGQIKDVKDAATANIKPITIWFQSRDGVEKKYRATDISGYCRASNLKYFSVRDLDEGPFFARVIIQGSLTLIALSSCYGEYYLGRSYSGLDSKLLKDAMRKSRFFLLHINKKSTHEINKIFFKDDMFQYFSDYPELQQMIADKQLKYEDIEIMVKKYNKWFAAK